MGTDEMMAFVLQHDILNTDALRRLTTKPWLVLHESFSRDNEHGGYYSALVSHEDVQNCLNKPSWDFRVGDGYPGVAIKHGEGKEIVEYYRYGSPGVLQPLVFIRGYHDLRKSHVEISEEFRHFHLAYWDNTIQTLTKFFDDGSEEIIGRVSGECVELRLAEVREFMVAKDMCLAIFFDITRFSEVDIKIIPEDEQRIFFKNESTCYDFRVSSNTFAPEKGKTFSRLLGKTFLSVSGQDALPQWYRKNEDESFQDFIIGVSDEGTPTTFTCNPAKLAGNFGGNSEAPHYLTPVFFRKDVLIRYYSNVSAQ